MKITGIIHAHTTHSYDGKLSLAELKKLLFKNGHSFCCLTEHTDEMTPEGAAAFVAECQQFSDQSFVFIPGFEVPYKNAHVLHIGTEKFWGQVADADTLQHWRSTTPWVVLAHPVRNNFIVDDTLLNVLDGVEVWNQQYEGKGAPRFRSLKLLRDLQRAKPDLLATGGLDFHRQDHYGTPIIELEVDIVNQGEVVNQLSHGFYTIKGLRVALSAQGNFLSGGGIVTRFGSRLSIVVIGAGKLANATLATLGIRLPRRLVQLIRQHV